ncbi:MAG: DUF4166 domain-containing protein [Fimbriimonadaceae bacterium]|nr:DUF4166 domain-containing protein [Fimbriimonadaceae bacterium]
MQSAELRELLKCEDPYAEAIGIAPEELPSGVRFSHLCPLNARGTVTVKRHPSWLVNLLVGVAGLPKSGENVPIVLVISRKERQRIRWYRQFGKQPVFTTHQIFGKEVREHFGIWSMRFRLEWMNDELRYIQTGFRALGLPIPRKLSPRTSAVVRAVEGEPEGWHVHVSIGIPPFGVVCEYEGKLCLQ